MNIGEKLKKYRKSVGLTQEQVAQKMKVSRTTISSWEINRTLPDIEKLIYLSEIYHVSLDQLLREEPQIMENIKFERKSLKRYQIVKYFAIVFISIFALYNVYWFTSVYPKNLKLSSNWVRTSSNNYYKKGNYTFQAHHLQYLEPLHNGNISVATYGKSPFDISIDGEMVFIWLQEAHGRSSLKLPKGVEIFGKIKRSEINKLNLLEYQGNIKEKDAEALIKKYKKELLDEYEETNKIWESVNK